MCPLFGSLSPAGAECFKRTSTSERKPQDEKPLNMSSLSPFSSLCMSQTWTGAEVHSKSILVRSCRLPPCSSATLRGKGKDASVFCPKTKKHATEPRGFLKPLALLFAFLSPFSRCVLVACYRKEIVLSPSSSYSLGVVIPLLLSSALSL